MEVCHFWSQLQALHRGTAVFVLLEFLPRVQNKVQIYLLVMSACSLSAYSGNQWALNSSSSSVCILRVVVFFFFPSV